MMKKTILLLLAFSLALLPAAAQTSHRQRVIQMAAQRIAEQIQVPPQDVDEFIGIYKACKKETSAILHGDSGGSEPCVQTSGCTPAEQAVEQKILSDFEKSRRLLDLRVRYYELFRRILKPSQIQKMYDLEKEAGFSKFHNGHSAAAEADVLVSD